MKVIGADTYPDTAFAKTPGFRYAPVGELLAASDVVTLHCPHEPGRSRSSTRRRSPR